MSDALRGFVLLLSIVLWLPVLRPFLDGSMRIDEAALRYAGALLLSWGGVSLLAAIVKAYTPQPVEEQTPEPTAPAGPAARPEATAAMDDDLLDDGVSELMPDGTPRRRADDLIR